MLDYDLVTSKARYRLPGRDDMPALLRLAAQSSPHSSPEDSRDRMLRTVRELSRRPERGSIFLFERKEDVVGYCVLVTHWSSLYGGNVLRIEELFLDRDHREDGLAEDFLQLLAQVAPAGTCAIAMDASPSDKGTTAICARAGFESRNGRIMTRMLPRDTPGTPAGGA